MPVDYCSQWEGWDILWGYQGLCMAFMPQRRGGHFVGFGGPHWQIQSPHMSRFTMWCLTGKVKPNCATGGGTFFKGFEHPNVNVPPYPPDGPTTPEDYNRKLALSPIPSMFFKSGPFHTSLCKHWALKVLSHQGDAPPGNSVIMSFKRALFLQLTCEV